jgi:hypothetical protein
MPKNRSAKSILTTAMENAEAEGQESPITNPDLAMKIADQIDKRISTKRFVKKVKIFTAVAAPMVLAASYAYYSTKSSGQTDTSTEA